MAEHSHIEWTDATWNPITGCTVVSPGCTNCYAMRLAGTRLKHHPSRQGLTNETKAGPVWNGTVRLNTDWITQPLRWTRPRRIFVCAHGDLFHEDVPDAWIDQVFAVMALAPHHTYQVLTKRSARMKAYMLNWPGGAARFHHVAFEADKLRPGMKRGMPDGFVWQLQKRWPLPNVWLGISAEDQERFDQRIDDLQSTPAAVRFVSFEPLLSAIHARGRMAGVHWGIVGGENGPRPTHPDWVRGLRDDAAADGWAFFFKQWGTNAWAEKIEGDPSTLTSYRTGKKFAGRTLDGVTHDAMPVTP